ncbi:hypothetical protein J4407_02420 [Candidatus Pacearchaeota archaeon]|nr:hypothetical protein [Candidatus Pacearchaeota archaeon]
MVKTFESFRDVSLEEIIKKVNNSDYFEHGFNSQNPKSLLVNKTIELEDGNTIKGFRQYTVYLKTKNLEDYLAASKQKYKDKVLMEIIKLVGCNPSSIKYGARFSHVVYSYDALLSLNPPKMERISLDVPAHL